MTTSSQDVLTFPSFFSPQNDKKKLVLKFYMKNNEDRFF